MKKMMEMLDTFAREEDGIALTEYLILLGMLVAALIVAVTAAGTSLAAAWGRWGGWWDTLDPPA